MSSVTDIYTKNYSEERKKQFEDRVREMEDGVMSEESIASMVAEEFRTGKKFGGRMGFKDGNGVADKSAQQKKFSERVIKLMDEEGYDFGEAVKEAMKEGYATGGRAGYVEGGPIHPRLGELSSGVSSAEEQLQQINQSLKTAETNLGESGPGGAGSVTPSVNGYESSGSSLYNESPAGEVSNPYQAPVGMDLIKSPMPGIPVNQGGIDPGTNPYDNGGGLGGLLGEGGGGTISNTMAPREPGQPIPDEPLGVYNPGAKFFGNTMPATPIATPGQPSLTQTAPKAADPYNNTTLSGLSQDGQRFDSAQNAFDALAAQTQKYRESSPYSRDVIGSELYQGEEGFKNFTKDFDKINNPSYTAPQLQGQLQSSTLGGGLGGLLGNNSGNKIMDTRDRSNDNRSYEERVRLAQEANDAPTGIMRNDGTRANLTYKNFMGLDPQTTNLNQLPT